ncbi:Hypothetical predicted protein [Cloeon dipterum]|uniref:Glucuronosyltransferase n=1 Tax=Cloeon dipterum TaxID=197152 RepID=A0A8S1CVM6_9INSE|nr:Hypothetical predicted protein [Cloeon dipterum]
MFCASVRQNAFCSAVIDNSLLLRIHGLRLSLMENSKTFVYNRKRLYLLCSHRGEPSEPQPRLLLVSFSKMARAFAILLGLASAVMMLARSSEASLSFLVLIMFGGASHEMQLQHLGSKLVARGHRVTFIKFKYTHEPPPLFHENVTYIALTVDNSNGRVPMMTREKEGRFKIPMDHVWTNGLKPWRTPMEGAFTFYSMCDRLLGDTQLLRQLRLSRFDVSIADLLTNECGLALASSLGVPTVGYWNLAFNGCELPFSGGLSTPTGALPSFMSGYTDRMSFAQRAVNLFYHLVTDVMVRVHFVMIDWVVQKHLPGTPGSQALLANLSGVLANNDFSLDFPREYPPNVVNVGCMQCRQPKPLPQDLEDFMQSSGEHGVILFSFGSTVDLAAPAAPPRLLRKILASFARMPQKVLMKLAGELPANTSVPENVRIQRWVPQQDVLGHPKTRLFFTHCGMNGAMELVWHGVPAVTLPVFADQADVSAMLVDRGVALRVDKDSTVDEIFRALETVTLDQKFSHEAHRLKQIFRNQMNSPIERAVWFVEMVASTKGAEHLKLASRTQNLVQKHNLDVIAVVISILLVTFECLLVSRKSVSFIEMAREVASLLFLSSVLFQLLSSSDGSFNFLVVNMIGGASHEMQLQHISANLMARGHKVTFLKFKHTLEPSRLVHNNITYIDLTLDNSKGNIPMITREKEGRFQVPMDRAWTSGLTPWRIPMDGAFTLSSMCDRMLGDAKLMKQLRLSHFDVSIADLLTNECGLALASSLGVPTVGYWNLAFNGCELPFSGGLSTPTGALPSFMSGYTDRMSFAQRAVNLFYHLVTDVLLRVHFVMIDRVVQKHLPGTPSSKALLANLSGVLANNDFSIDFPREYPPNVVNVGCMQCRQPKPLPQDLDEFMSSSGEHGVILFSFGSTVDLTAHAAPSGLLQKILASFARMPQKVLMKLTGKLPANTSVPENVRIQRWVPQQDVLGHPKTRLFFTHCGMNGAMELVWHGVPAVTLPVFADQADVSAMLVDRGVALRVDKDFTVNEIVKTLQTVISNQKFSSESYRLKQIFRNRMTSPTERAVWFVEMGKLMPAASLARVKRAEKEMSDGKLLPLLPSSPRTMMLPKGGRILEVCMCVGCWQNAENPPITLKPRGAEAAMFSQLIRCTSERRETIPLVSYETL